MKTQFPTEWRTQSKWKRRLYARYMTWLERIGYTVVILVIGAFIFACTYRVDDIITADKVQISAAAISIPSTDATYVIRQLVPDFTDVEAGQPVLEIVTGEQNVKQYLAWQILADIGSADRIAKPPLTVLNAPSAGTLVVSAGILQREVATEVEIAQIRNYQDLRMKPTLTGQGTPNAVPNGVATLRAIVVEPAAGVLLRGSTAGASIISGQLVTQSTKDAIQTSLASTGLKIRDDIPLQVLELADLQIDADLTLSDGVTGSGTLAEPPPTTVLRADVISGTHVATVQLASLAPDMQEKVKAILTSSIEGKPVTTLDGSTKTISEVKNLKTVFKVKATPGIDPSSMEQVPGTAVSRGFEAVLKIQSPPSYLIQAVRNADMTGKTVTAKVELKTGDRPIATLLLKRS